MSPKERAMACARSKYPMIPRDALATAFRAWEDCRRPEQPTADEEEKYGLSYETDTSPPETGTFASFIPDWCLGRLMGHLSIEKSRRGVTVIARTEAGRIAIEAVGGDLVRDIAVRLWLAFPEPSDEDVRKALNIIEEE